MFDACLAPFDPGFRDALAPCLAPSASRRTACFDADGTLWNEDIGEAFFRWLIAGDLLPTVDCTRDVYAEYEARVRADRAEGQSWAVRCMAGLPEADVVRWSRQMAAAWPNYRPEMAGLVRALGAAGWDVWIVSATNRWTVSEASDYVGVARSHVIGMEVEVVDGRLTDRAVLPLTCLSGKVEAIAKRVTTPIDLAVGDSPGDLDLLQAARLALAVGRHDRSPAFLDQARANGWAVHVF